MAADVKRGFFAGIVMSLRLTAGSVKLVFRYPKVLILPLLTLLAVSTLVVVPLGILVWAATKHSNETWTFFGHLYFVTSAAFRDGNIALAVSSAIIETYLLWSIWMIPVLTSVLFFSGVGMDVAVQQVRGHTPDLGAAFRVVGRRFGRIVLLAAFIATVYTWFHYLLTIVLRPIPFVGKWILRGLKLVLTAVSYLMLPIVVYEDAGPWAACRSAWRCVRKTWSGLLVGTGIASAGVFVLTEIIIAGIARQVLGLDDTVVAVFSLAAAGAVYALSVSVAAALRGVLYVYATTGELLPGFEAESLPRIEQPSPFTVPGQAPKAI